MARGASRVAAVLGVAFIGLAGCSDVLPGETTRGDPSLIIGGDPDTTSRAIVAIQTADGGFCSGSLLLPNLVLTAQHCVAELADPEAPVQCGVTMFTRVHPAEDFLVTWDADLSNGAPNESIYEVNLVVVPPSSSLCGNDIAMLRLSTNVPESQTAPLIPRVDSRPTVDELFDAVGYGIQSPNDQTGQTAGERMRVNGLAVGCVGAQACNGTGATGTEWAAESPICSGDSGGPALDAQSRVIGVVSRGDPDCTIGIYSAVDSWKDLIIDTAVDAADDGGYEPPAWTGNEPTDGGVPDAGMDAGTDAGMDAGMDAGDPTDAGMDAGMDAGTDAGNPTDAGIDAGADAGPDAGNPRPDAGTDAGTPDASPMMDGGSPLGEACTNACRDGYLCYADDNEPPGICVPPCETTSDCPDGYHCSTLGACTPDSHSGDSDDATTSAGCACRTTGHAPGTGTPWLVLAVLASSFAGIRRRRRAA